MNTFPSARLPVNMLLLKPFFGIACVFKMFRLCFQNVSLEKQLDTSHRSNIVSHSSTLGERASFIEGWKTQVNSLRVRQINRYRIDCIF